VQAIAEHQLGATDPLVAGLKEELSRAQLRLPTLPDVAMQVTELARNEHSSVAQVAAAIANDPAVTARVLAIVNSAWSGNGHKIHSLTAAVTRLGMKMTRLLVTRVAMEQMFVATSPGLRALMQETWQRSLEIAALCEVLARNYTRLAPDQAMLAGLLHRIGALAIIRIASERPALVRCLPSIGAAIEQLQADVGSQVLAAWHLSEELQVIPRASCDYARRHTGPADYADVVMVATLLTDVARGVRPKGITLVPALSKLGFDADVQALEAATPGGQSGLMA
jgi:HD-like signal output (HDOD) protein